MDKRKLKETLLIKYKDTDLNKDALNNIFDSIYTNNMNEKNIKSKFDEIVKITIDLKEKLSSKYIDFNVDNKYLNDVFNKIVCDSSDFIEISGKFEKVIDNYVIEEIRKGKIDINIIHNKYLFLKKMVKMNSKYNIDPEKMDKCYNNAVLLLKARYDENQTMSFNILGNMKYVISQDLYNIDINSFIKYDISFMKEYLELSKDDNIEKISNETGLNKDLLYKYIYNNETIMGDQFELLCILYDCENYDEFKSKIINKTQVLKNLESLKKVKEIQDEKNKEKEKKRYMEIKEKITQKDKKYDLSFLKEYAILYNITRGELSSKLHCGAKKVDDILNGNLLVKENIIDDIAYEFGANSYEELRKKIAYKTYIKYKNQNKKMENKTIEIEAIEEKELFEMLKLKQMPYKECLITLLLFSKETNKSVDEISEFLKINKSYVLKVYINDLEKIKQSISKDNYTIKLIHNNEEVD